jgi:hypothetical protein
MRIKAVSYGMFNNRKMIKLSGTTIKKAALVTLEESKGFDNPNYFVDMATYFKFKKLQREF